MKYFHMLLVFSISFIAIMSGRIHVDSLDLVFLLTAFICSVFLFLKDEESFSLFKTVHIFYLLFFSIAPAVQFADDIQLFVGNFTFEQYYITARYSLLSLVIFDGCYFLFRSFVKPFAIISSNEVVFSKKKTLLLLLISISIFSFFFYFNNYNILSLFIRSGELVNRQSVSKMNYLIMTNFLRPMTMVIFLLYSYAKNNNKFILFLLFVLFVMTCPPTGIARYSVAALYLPVFIRFVPILRKKNIFVYSVIIAFIVVFPLLNIFRYYDEESVVKIEMDFYQFKTMHFDAFSMFMRTIRSDIITWGQQLLGVFFFWVPRRLWPDKPISSGQFVAEQEGVDFTNLSLPYPAEGYINYGMFGLFFFMVVLAWFFAKLDKMYIDNKKEIINTPYELTYLILLGFCIYLLRGDLMNAFAYICGFLLSNYVVRRLMSI